MIPTSTAKRSATPILRKFSFRACKPSRRSPRVAASESPTFGPRSGAMTIAPMIIATLFLARPIAATTAESIVSAVFWYEVLIISFTSEYSSSRLTLRAFRCFEPPGDEICSVSSGAGIKASTRRLMIFTWSRVSDKASASVSVISSLCSAAARMCSCDLSSDIRSDQMAMTGLLLIADLASSSLSVARNTTINLTAIASPPLTSAAGIPLPGEMRRVHRPPRQPRSP